MSTTTATLTPRKRLFAELLEERYTHADESQLDVAEWLQDYMDNHDIEADLAEAERTATDDNRDATMDAIAVIRSYMASNARLPTLFQVGQAAVSKWKNTKSSPTPEKWPAVARYLGLSLAETHRLITFHEMPESVVALQYRLASAAKENRDLQRDLATLRAEQRRTERAVRETNEELARLRSIATSIEQGDPVGVS